MADAIVSLEALFKQYQNAVEKQVLAAIDQVMDSMAQAQSRITELETELASGKRRSAELQLEVERLDHQRTVYLFQRDELRAEVTSLRGMMAFPPKWRSRTDEKDPELPNFHD